MISSTMSHITSSTNRYDSIVSGVRGWVREREREREREIYMYNIVVVHIITQLYLP